MKGIRSTQAMTQERGLRTARVREELIQAQSNQPTSGSIESRVHAAEKLAHFAGESRQHARASSETRQSRLEPRLCRSFRILEQAELEHALRGRDQRIFLRTRMPIEQALRFGAALASRLRRCDQSPQLRRDRTAAARTTAARHSRPQMTGFIAVMYARSVVPICSTG